MIIPLFIIVLLWKIQAPWWIWLFAICVYIDDLEKQKRRKS